MQRKIAVGLVKYMLLVVLGFALLFMPKATLIAIAQLIAVFLIVQGVLSGVSALWYKWKSNISSVLIFEFVVGLIVGFVIIYKPEVVISYFVLSLAIWAVIGGLLLAFSFNRLRRSGYTSWVLFTQSVVALTFGLILIFEPLRSGFALASIIGVFVLLHGLLSFVSVLSRQ